MSEALEILKSCDAFLEATSCCPPAAIPAHTARWPTCSSTPTAAPEVMKVVADKVKEMDVDVIVGPAMGGIVYAYELAARPASAPSLPSAWTM